MLHWKAVALRVIVGGLGVLAAVGGEFVGWHW